MKRIIPPSPRPVQEENEYSDRYSYSSDVSHSSDILSLLILQLSSLLSLVKTFKTSDDVFHSVEDMPPFWISKWVDYSNQYGIGYQLCDKSIGVLFNDGTKLLIGSRDQLLYIDKNNVEENYSTSEYPEWMNKKAMLLMRFKVYMEDYIDDHLLKTYEGMAPKDGNELASIPYLCDWFRTKSAIILYLSNGTVQINFFVDHSKVIICPLLGSVSFIDAHKKLRVLKLSLIEEYGCTKELYARLKYAKAMCERLVPHSSSRQEPLSYARY